MDKRLRFPMREDQMYKLNLCYGILFFLNAYIKNAEQIN